MSAIAGTRSWWQLWPDLTITPEQGLATLMAANIVKSWHSFSIKCLYFLLNKSLPGPGTGLHSADNAEVSEPSGLSTFSQQQHQPEKWHRSIEHNYQWISSQFQTDTSLIPNYSQSIVKGHVILQQYDTIDPSNFLFIIKVRTFLYLKGALTFELVQMIISTCSKFWIAHLLSHLISYYNEQARRAIDKKKTSICSICNDFNDQCINNHHFSENLLLSNFNSHV